MLCQVAQRGLTWSSLHESVTPDFPFSAARVFIMISIDVVLYAVLALYLDKVSAHNRDGIVAGSSGHVRCSLGAFDSL